MSKKKVSIVIPVKNRPKLVQETLRSVQAQTYPRWEAVVVDDQSTDDTREAVAAMASRDERIRLFRRSGEKEGAPVCRNIGWENAQGEYVVFLDSDDLLAEDCLEQRVQCMESHSGLDFAVFGTYLFDERPGDRKEVFNVPTDEDPLDRFLKLDLPWQTTGPIYRRSAVVQIGGWNEDLSCGQDVDYGVRSLCHDLKYRHNDSVDYYRRTGASEGPRVGEAPWSLENLPMRQKRVEATYRVLSETGNLTESRKLRVAGNLLHLAERWVELEKIDRARATWRACKDLGVVSEDVFCFIDQYLKRPSTLWGRYMAYYMCRQFPSELFVPGSTNRRDPEEEAKPTEDFPLQDYRNPYHRYAFILINGPVGYTVRRLASSLGMSSYIQSLRKTLKM